MAISGGDSAESFAEQPMARQLERLTNSQRELREQSGSQPLGLNPPMGLLDQSTVAALKRDTEMLRVRLYKEENRCHHVDPNQHSLTSQAPCDC